MSQGGETFFALLLRRCNLISTCFLNEAGVTRRADGEGHNNQRNNLRARVRLEDIGSPMDFRHVAHLGHGDVDNTAVSSSDVIDVIQKHQQINSNHGNNRFSSRTTSSQQQQQQQQQRIIA